MSDGGGTGPTISSLACETCGQKIALASWSEHLRVHAQQRTAAHRPPAAGAPPRAVPLPSSSGTTAGTTAPAAAATTGQATGPQAPRRRARSSAQSFGGSLVDTVANREAGSWRAAEAAVAVRDLVARHAPDKLEGVPSLLRKWKGKEDQLLEQVRRKYEPPPV
jgi:hypothetical protein